MTIARWMICMALTALIIVPATAMAQDEGPADPAAGLAGDAEGGRHY